MDQWPGAQPDRPGSADHVYRIHVGCRRPRAHFGRRHALSEYDHPVAWKRKTKKRSNGLPSLCRPNGRGFNMPWIVMPPPVCACPEAAGAKKRISRPSAIVSISTFSVASKTTDLLAQEWLAGRLRQSHGIAAKSGDSCRRQWRTESHAGQSGPRPTAGDGLRSGQRHA